MNYIIIFLSVCVLVIDCQNNACASPGMKLYETTCHVRERSPGKHVCRKKKLCESQFHADSRRHLFKRVDVGITSCIPLITYS